MRIDLSSGHGPDDASGKPAPRPPALPALAVAALERVARNGTILWLTGAGISAESGIPTFRGPEGYWRVGSKNYQPQELATRSAFDAMPEAIWAWYLYRRSVCRAAVPNAAHLALAALDRALADRSQLVTQNVDGLHRRAGARDPLEIHGNLDYMRCADECVPRGPASLLAYPVDLPEKWERDRALTPDEAALLRCPRCSAWARPHVLWFDEFYDEPLFRAESALAVAERARLLVVVGTAGQTNLPQQLVRRVAENGFPILVVDVNPGVFDEAAEKTGGAVLRGPAGLWVPTLTATLLELRDS